MYIKLFITTALLAVISAKDNNLFYFSKDKNSLSDCIEDHYVFKVRYKGLGLGKTVANNTGLKFARRIMERKEIEMEVTDMFMDLVNEISTSSKIEIPWIALEVGALRALLDCSDNHNDDTDEESVGSSSSVNRESNVHLNLNTTFSYFDEKPSELGVVLDYVLVDWEEPLEEMIQTREGRSILRRYAHNGLIILLQTLISFKNDHDRFRFMLRSLWNSRARRYFDGRKKYPYIIHRYTLNLYSEVVGDINRMSSTRSAEDFNERNPPASQTEVNRILNVHVADRPTHTEYDNFAHYRREGMSSSQHHIESHLIQFYRIIFYMMELKIHGIATDDDDEYEGPIPHEKMSKYIQDIIHNDCAYSRFLLAVRGCLLNTLQRANIETGQRLLSARVFEEDLIWILSNFPRYAFRSTTTSTTQNPAEEGIDEVDPAIMECFSENFDNSNTCSIDRGLEMSDQYNIVPAPRAKTEPHFLAGILDFILVDFPMPLRDMIRTRNGRALLRRFTTEAMLKIVFATRLMKNNDFFRFILREMWLRRADLYFDGHSELPYMVHRYMSDNPFPYTYKDMVDSLSARSAQNFTERDFLISQDELSQILRVLVLDDSGQTSDLSTDYQRTRNMTIAQHYYESHLIQLYRLVLYFIELDARDISTNAEDDYEGPVPNTVMSDVIQSIVWDDENLRKYLLMKLKRTFGNEGGQRNIESLILELIKNLSEKLNTTTTAATVAVMETMSTTPKYDRHAKRKGCRKNKKKNSCKQSGAEVSQQQPKEEKKQKQQGQKKKSYGYIELNGDSKLHFSSEVDESVFLNLLASLGESYLVY